MIHTKYNKLVFEPTKETFEKQFSVTEESIDSLFIKLLQWKIFGFWQSEAFI